MVDPKALPPWIASVGHSDHPIEVFFALLTAHRVQTLIDVRSHPKSHYEQYNKAQLVASARDHGITYHHLPGLGGKRETDYRLHMETPEWQASYRRLKAIALSALHQGHAAAFMCVERDPADCHRRHIGAKLEADGWRVGPMSPDLRQRTLF